MYQRDYQAVFLGLLYDWSHLAAIISATFSIGIAADGILNGAVRAFCFFLGSAIMIGTVAWLIGEIPAQREKHALHMREVDAIVQQMNPAPPVAAPASRVPFPSPLFVQFIWDWRERTGKFPTVRQCGSGEAGNTRFANVVAQQGYADMVAAGAIVGRVEGQHAGDPAPGWTRERFEKAARDDATLHSDPLPRAA